MTGIISTMFTYVSVDFREVYRCLGSDMIIFVAAMLGYLMLQHVKKGATQSKVVEPLSKEFASEEEQWPAQVITAESKQKEPNQEQPAAPRTGTCQLPEPPPPQQQLQTPEEQLDVNKQMALMQKYAASRNIKDTLRTFRFIEQSGECMSSPMYNTVMRAWIKCGNIWAAENWMEETKLARMADESSYLILVKALMMIRDIEKARGVLQDMREAQVAPSVAIFDELLTGLARGGLFNDGISLLKEMEVAGVQPAGFTRESITALMNSARKVNQSFDSMHLLLKHCAEPKCGTSQLPRLAAALLHAMKAKPMAACVHEVEIKGSLARIKAVRKTLKRQGFLNKAECDALPLDGHWETDHGLPVIIEGKMVRWSQQRASKLRFTSPDCKTCSLIIYGEHAKGQLVEPLVHGATKALRWDNGDVWHSFAGRVIDHVTLFGQTMTKTLRDIAQDEAHRAQTKAVLSCVSKQGLRMPSILEASLMDYIGNDLYYLQVHFESKSSRADVIDTISCCHPRVGVRHCWAKPGMGSCGQRTLANGEETDDSCFNRHIDAVSRA
jgi:pentatricopeptide repeat protein